MSTQRLMQFNPITFNLPLLLRGWISITVPVQVYPLAGQRRSSVLPAGGAWNGEPSPAAPAPQHSLPLWPAAP